MSALKRSPTLRGGPGMSANDTQQYLFNAINEVKNHYTPGTNEWFDFNEKRRLLHIEWQNARTTSTNNESFKEYAASHSLVNFGRRGGKHRRRPSRKYKKSAKRVFRKKSRSTRRR